MTEKSMDEKIEDEKKLGILLKLKSESRRESMKWWDDWIGFWVTKGSGAVASVVGVSETLDPNLLPIDLAQPPSVLAVGITLLAGKKILTLAGKMNDSLRKENGN